MSKILFLSPLLFSIFLSFNSSFAFATPVRCDSLLSGQWQNFSFTDRSSAQAIVTSPEVQRTFDFLSKEELSVFVLYQHADLTVLEIAKRLNFSEGEVEATLFQVDGVLKDLLKSESLAFDGMSLQFLAMKVSEARASEGARD